MSKRFDGYIPKEYYETMKKLNTILEAEGSNFSHWVRLQAEAYVEAHENPKAPNTAVPYPAACTFVGCSLPAAHWGLEGKVWFGYCSDHWGTRKFSVYR
jgi:hypothetical protein